MLITGREAATRACVAAFLVPLVFSSVATAADDKPYVMKITLATVDDDVHQFAKDYAAAVEKTREAASRLKSIPQANWARSSAKLRAYNSAQSRPRSSRPNSLLPSMSGLKF